MVLSYEWNRNFRLFHNLFFPNLPIASLDSEHHILENKDWENDGLKG
jgi:hypothetical protein